MDSTDFQVSFERCTTPQAIELLVRLILKDGSIGIHIDEQTDKQGVLYTIRIDDPAKNGQVLGKHGHTIDAIRGLVRIIGYINHEKAALKLATPKKQI